MRPMVQGEAVEGLSVMEKSQSLAAVEELWNEWEIHCLILTSLFLQVFLFLAAGMRTRNTSWKLRTTLWLAYLLADSVAFFVLGHLAVHTSKPGHQLMSFWAPFVLVHLGGQETITAFSKQDNELWNRHLLSLINQSAIAVYVVAKVSWPDSRLRAAMVIMLLSGCFKYAERTICLFLGSPGSLRRVALTDLSLNVQGYTGNNMEKTLDMMSKGSSIGLLIDIHATDAEFILRADVPINTAYTIREAKKLPGMLTKFLSNANHHRAYEFVGELLVQYYQHLYTKLEIRECFYIIFTGYILPLLRTSSIRIILPVFCMCTFSLLYIVFQYASALVALLLFMAAESEGQLNTTRKADVTVSYILLIGAVVQDLSSAIMFVFSNVRYNLPSSILHVANCIRSAWGRKLWSEELAQYKLIKMVLSTPCISFSWHRIDRRLFGPLRVGLLKLSSTPLTEDHTPMKKFILDNLLLSGIKKEWNIASSRGQLALQKWMERHQAALISGASSENPLVQSVGSGVDFPTSVLIWHIATDISYYYGDSPNTNDSDQIKKDKQVSSELSSYTMYLVFNCGVMLSNNSQIVHDKARDEIRKIFSDQQVILDEKDAVIKMFEAGKKEDPMKYNNSPSNYLEVLKRTLKDLDSPLLPRACVVAQELISINDEAKRWGLIASVWSEMLYFIAPRCGSAFHYEHLATGGEFITHVLLLMSFLGPFLPPHSV